MGQVVPKTERAASFSLRSPSLVHRPRNWSMSAMAMLRQRSDPHFARRKGISLHCLIGPEILDVTHRDWASGDIGPARQESFLSVAIHVCP